MSNFGGDDQFYQTTLNEAKKKIEIIDSQIEEELAKVKDVIENLQEQKKAVRQIYDGACMILGVENIFEEEDEETSGE